MQLDKIISYENKTKALEEQIVNKDKYIQGFKEKNNHMKYCSETISFQCQIEKERGNQKQEKGCCLQ